jgi:BirA family biotin operon repressor/biotin-[acetyl-CoA-carboxylase] ligase
MSVSTQTLRLASLLAADTHHSGQDIAETLGISRAAVWKHVEHLRALGIEVTAAPGRGYRLAQSLELLDERAIRDSISDDHCPAELIILPETDSSNAEVWRRPAGRRHRVAVLAERQSGGRGRRGRHWLSPFGRNVYLSIGWRFEGGLASLACLPLVVALAAARAVSRAGLAGHGIKWPNDLVIDDAKFGGCLIEVQGDPQGPCQAVLGVGINVCMAGAPGLADIDRVWTDLASSLPGISRNGVAGLLIDEILAAVELFARDGFAPFRPEWDRLDVLRGRTICVQAPDGEQRGRAAGLGPQGGLLLECAGVVSEHLAGEATLRARVKSP